MGFFKDTAQRNANLDQIRAAAEAARRALAKNGKNLKPAQRAFYEAKIREAKDAGLT